MTGVWRAFDAIGMAALVLVPLLAAGLAFGVEWLRRRLPDLVSAVAAILVFASLTLALAMTMRPAADVGTRLPWNLNPFPSLLTLVTGMPVELRTPMDALGNLLLLLPLGCFVALLSGPRAAAWLVPAVALALETTQWLQAAGRAPEVADVLLNTAGGWAGVGLAVLAGRVISGTVHSDADERTDSPPPPTA